MNTYRVTARRSGDWWALEVPDLPGVFSQAKRLDTAGPAAREAIAVMLDTSPENIDVAIEPQLPPAVKDVLDDVAEAQQASREAAERERRAMQHAAAVLTRDLSQRDAGRVLGVSFQRVSQLLRPKGKPASGSGGESGHSHAAA